MYSVIDIGSNSMRLSVYQIENGQLKPLISKKEMTGLAGHVESGCLTEKGIRKAIDGLNRFQLILKNFKTSSDYVIATASLRNIQNREEAVRRIEAETGLSIHVITGAQEAYYDFVGATHCVQTDSGLMVDVGGGSTELLFYRGGQVEKALSIPLGSLNLYTRVISRLLPDKKERRVIKECVLEQLQEIAPMNVPSALICGVGGTNRALCKLNNDIFTMSADNMVVETDNLKAILKMLQKEDKETILKILQVTPERIHTIIPGLIILKTIAKFYHCSRISVSRFGVREGYLIENELRRDTK